ncbi:IS481 family transposase, partial [Mesorhizobium caraganae]|nr:IS481 family transposase [Mesorhizobium caraganae]
AADFLRKLIELVPYKIHTVLTDNGIHFTVPGGASWSVPEIRAMIERKEIFRAHSFDVACARNDIEHPTVRRYYYENHDQLRAHLATFLDAYNFAKRLKSLSGLTPFEHICKIWTEQPQRFRLNPSHHMAGPNI